MSKLSFEALREIRWRRSLTPEEQACLRAWLAEHPEDVDRWEREEALDLALERLEPATPGPDFTRNVMALIEAEGEAMAGSVAQGRGETRRVQAEESVPWWVAVRDWLVGPRAALAWAAVMLLAVGLAFRAYHERSENQVVEAVRSISVAAEVTNPEVLQDFEAIREFSQVRAEASQTDEALYVLLGQ